MTVPLPRYPASALALLLALGITAPPTVAVAVGGRIIWAEGFGWADMENKVGADPLPGKARTSQKIVVAVVTNLENADPTKPASEIADIFAAALPR